MKQNWRPIVGYEGIYEASDLGGIKRVCRGRSTHIGRLLSFSLNHAGYANLRLHRQGKTQSLRRNRVVWSAFNGPIPIGMQINHINGIRTDDRLQNLEMVTPSENVAHSFRSLSRHIARGAEKKLSKLTETDIPAIVQLRNSGLKLREIAAIYQVTETLICGVCSGKLWRHVPR